jgi:hypothetical protein
MPSPLPLALIGLTTLLTGVAWGINLFVDRHTAAAIR